MKEARSALADTPNQLEVLNKYNVVDAGGKAFTYFLQGIIDFVKKGKLQHVSRLKKRVSVEIKAEDIKKAQFCAECCVQREGLERMRLIETLNSLGRDLIFYGSSQFAKIHVNTEKPEDVFTCVEKFGDVTQKKIFTFEPEPPDHEKEALAFVSDTTCDIADEYIENNDIYFVPVKVQTADKIYTDKVDIIQEEFYEIMNSSSIPPKTSQPSLVDFSRVYKHLLVHYKSIIAVQLSGALSGTYQTARQAAYSVNPKRIIVLDGKNISVGLGIIVMEGIKAVRDGLEYEKVLGRINEAVENVTIFIGIPTLKYLVKGGRVTKTKGLIARILNINPILTIDKQGSLVPKGKTRGKKKLEQKLFDMLSEAIKEPKATHPGYDVSVAVAHTNDPHSGKSLAEKISQDLGLPVIMIMNAAPVLGAHAGPGALGVGFLKSK